MPPMSNRTLRPQRKRPDAPRILTADQARGLTWTMPASNGSKIVEFRVYENGSLTDVTAGDQTEWFTPSAGVGYEVTAVNAVGEGRRSRRVIAA